jgi:hypothetical protein
VVVVPVLLGGGFNFFGAILLFHLVQRAYT